MKIKTNELTGAALDWAVGKCEGMDIGLGPRGCVVYYFEGYPAMWRPSTDWAQGGPIIGRERICSDYLINGQWLAVSRITEAQGYGPTSLIAAMRCYVASKLGDEVDVPEELCRPTA